MENKKVNCNPMSIEFQEEARKLGLTGYQLVAKYKEEGYKSLDNEFDNIVCPNCDGDNLRELLQTPNGNRLKCEDCDEIFVDRVTIADNENKDDVLEIELVKNDNLRKSKNIRKRFVSKETYRSEEILDNNKKYYVFLNDWEKGENGGRYISIEKYEARNSKIYEDGKVWINKQQLTITNVEIIDKIIKELLKLRNEFDSINN